MTAELTYGFVGMAVLIGAVISYLIWSHASTRKNETIGLERAGFVACTNNIADLERRVRRLHDHASLDVCRVYEAKFERAGIYRYELEIGDSEDSFVTEEFLFPLRRDSRAPFAIFVLPEKLPEGLAKNLLISILGKTEKLIPPGTEQIEVPLQLQSRILTALGPPGSTLHSLIDDRLLTDLLHTASRGFFAIRGIDDDCAMEVISSYGRRALPDFDWQIAAKAVQDLAQRHGLR